MKSISEIPALIRAKWNCVSYARDVLGLPVSRDGDRCTSIMPGPHQHSDGFIVHDDYWFDFSGSIGGDVIELCAIARHNGDRGEAFRELGSEFFTSNGFKPSVYRRHQESLSAMIERWHEALRPEDRQYLHDRRITDETIDRLKLGYCGDSRSGMYDRIIIPYWRNGSPVYYAGRDCSGKWKVKNSGVSKYKKMWTGKNEYTENVMWGLHTQGKDWCDDPEKDSCLCILEGQFDVMSFEQERWHVLSPIGGYFAKKLMPLIRSMCRKYKKVFICMDNDGPGVAFQVAMAKFLFSNQIPFVCGHVPSEYNGHAIKDVSDYYSAGGDLTELVRNATYGLTDLARSFKEGDEKEFHDFMLTAGRYADKAELVMLAKHVTLDSDFVKECVKEAKKPPLESQIAEEIVKGHDLLYQVGDGYYEYAHGVWGEIPMLAVQSYAREMLGKFATSANTGGVARHVAILKYSTSGFNTQNVINLLDGVLDLESMTMQEHSPAFMSSVQIPRCYDPKADCPKTRKFVSEIVAGVEEKAKLIQQMCGSIFMKDNKLNRAFFLMGEGSNGKSVLLELIRYVIDPRNCSTVRLGDMADRFEPLRLKNSLVNITTETQVNLRGAEDSIKTVISGETISAAHKGVDAIEFKPRCKIICACNNFIHSKDVTYAFVRRLKFIVFPVIFNEKTANDNLLEELKEEAAGILNWMIEGWHMLNESGRFITTGEEAETKEEFLILANPLAGFIRFYLSNIHSTKMTASEMFFEHYKGWAKKANITPQLNEYEFYRQIGILMKQMKPEVRHVKHGGRSMYIFPAEETFGNTDSEWENI